jgi:hypothetical protein
MSVNGPIEGLMIGGAFDPDAALPE